jgi:hypothetical protein
MATRLKKGQVWTGQELIDQDGDVRLLQSGGSRAGYPPQASRCAHGAVFSFVRIGALVLWLGVRWLVAFLPIPLALRKIFAAQQPAAVVS